MARLSTDYDRIITSVPLDRTASVVRDGDGEHFDPLAPVGMLGGRAQWDIQPPSVPMSPALESLIGRSFGRLKVVGYLGKGGGSGTGTAVQRWTVRCVCGAFESRRGKAIKAADPDDRCGRCAYVEEGRKLLIAATTGKWPDGRPANIEAGLKTRSGVRLLKGAAQ